MGGPAKGNNKIIISEYDRRPLPENWQHTHLVNHLRYKGKLVYTKDRCGCIVELQVGKHDDAMTVCSSSLEDALRKMEKKLENIL